MLRAALAVFMIGGIAAWGQAQSDTTSGADKADKVDRATAYYHFTLAHLYAEMASVPSARSLEYADKAEENYQAAIKADPKTPDPKAVRPLLSPIYIRRRPAPSSK
jgi:hypothetical protein